MADSKKTTTITLSEPVVVEGKTYSELTFRRMKAKDALLGEGEKSKTRAGYILFAALADVPVEVIEELDADDLDAAGEAASQMMGKRAQELAKRQRQLLTTTMLQ